MESAAWPSRTRRTGRCWSYGMTVQSGSSITLEIRAQAAGRKPSTAAAISLTVEIPRPPTSPLKAALCGFLFALTKTLPFRENAHSSLYGPAWARYRARCWRAPSSPLHAPGLHRVVFLHPLHRRPAIAVPGLRGASVGVYFPANPCTTPAFLRAFPGAFQGAAGRARIFAKNHPPDRHETPRTAPNSERFSALIFHR